VVAYIAPPAGATLRFSEFAARASAPAGSQSVIHPSSFSPARRPASRLKPATEDPFFRFDSLIFALKTGFVLSLFFAQKTVKSCVFNKSLSLFPLF
jgi:hypothetical protein